MVKIIYKHWKSGEILELIGTMPEHLNNEQSDRFIIRTDYGKYEDILKHTVVRIESISGM
tara:strand:- start:1332 stop:1511 length:180 start_codon:yes stop_codon:yes gene_type:complete